LAAVTTSLTLRPGVTRRDHTIGPESAVITLVEYGDYESAAALEARGVVIRAQERLGDFIRFTFRHYAVPKGHAQALRAAEAAEAAGSQGKFWQMHNTLYAHQGALDNGHLVEYADAIGLDTARFLREMAGHMHLERIKELLQSGIASGVKASPAFFVNGIRVEGEFTDDNLRKVMEQVGKLG